MKKRETAPIYNYTYPLRTPGSVPFFRGEGGGGLAGALIVETSFPDPTPIK